MVHKVPIPAFVQTSASFFSSAQPSLYQRQLFHECVHAVFGQWTALQTAIEDQWGGPSSRQKADQLIADVLNFFQSSPASKGHVDVDDLADFLWQKLATEFNTDLQDDSECDVADHLVEIYSVFQSGQDLTPTYTELQGVKSLIAPHQRVSRPESSSSDDEDMEDDGWQLVTRRH